MQKDALWRDPHDGVPVSPLGYARRQRASQRAARAFTHHVARGAPRPPGGTLSPKWQVDFGPDFQPRRLLAGPRGVVACGVFMHYEGRCRIVRWRGEVVGDVPNEAPGAALDRRGAHLLTTAEDEPAVYRLSNGRGVGGLPVLDRLVETHRFSSFYLFCTQYVPPWPSQASKKVGAELLFLPSVSARHLLGSRPVIQAFKVGHIFSHGEVVRGAAGPSGVVLATEHGLQWTDWMLQPTKLVRMSMRPVAIAVGPDEDVVLVTEIEDRPHLLVFAPDGSERARVVLPEAKVSGLFIGEDNLAVVSADGYVRAFDMDGTVAWELSRQGKTAAVALDDEAVMFERDLGLWVRERSGTTRQIWTAPAPLTTSPVPYRHRWYVATANTLYALRI
jgi:hypothetical protein